MMNSKIIISLFLLLIIAFSSCKKDEPAGPKVYVPAYLKAMVPYTNGQTVTFSNGAGQLVSATVSITSRFYYNGVCSSCASAPNPEIITYTLNAGTNRFMVFEVTPETYISLSIYSPMDSYQLTGALDFSVESGVSQGSCFAQRQACLPSITLNGKTFTNVLEITAIAGPSTIAKAYHTVSQGIVGFIHKNGTTYALD